MGFIGFDEGALAPTDRPQASSQGLKESFHQLFLEELVPWRRDSQSFGRQDFGRVFWFRVSGRPMRRESQSLGVRVWGLGFRIWGSGFRV